MNSADNNRKTVSALEGFEKGIYSVLETYSNVHRGSGFNSVVTTHLFDQARLIILQQLGLDQREYTSIFCTPRRAVQLIPLLKPGDYKTISSEDYGLPLGLVVIAAKKKALPGGIPFQTGGGTARLVSRDWVIWEKTPGRFEAGTPAIVNIIAMVKLIIQSAESRHLNLQNDSVAKLTSQEILYHDTLFNYSGIELLSRLKQTLIGKDLIVPTTSGSKAFINLDNGASTPTFEPVWEAVRNTWRQPKSVQQDIVRDTRMLCSKALGAPLDNYEVVFTSNTTEAINLVSENLEKDSTRDTVVVNTMMEHNSNELPWRNPWISSLIRLNINEEGIISNEELERVLRAYNLENIHGKKRIRLVAVSGASNVLGVFNDIEKISSIVHQYHACLLVDAAQMIAHRKVEIEKWGIDYLVFSAHKAYAPFGTGVLIVRKDQLKFNSQDTEQILSSGDGNATGIAALGKALVLLQRVGMDVIQKEEQRMTATMLKGMAQIPGLKVYGIKDPASPGFNTKGGVVVFEIKHKLPGQIAAQLALDWGIGIRYGCHCSHILIKHILHVPPWAEQLQRMMLRLVPGMNLPGLARLSLGIENDDTDVEILLTALKKISEKTRKESKGVGVPDQKETTLLTKSEVKRKIKRYLEEVTASVYS